ncbi:hypothetical protein AEST_10450 [Alishewanella aestuarii B11]|uniref:Uncharacterized protein n=1 Tax=Alishewanella aestuarii B11 TaxID=1197174 RepID=J1Q4C2_9ALTE|nr:hypothetical protein AEST_10450 [Alishewanella aestuarii B11]
MLFRFLANLQNQINQLKLNIIFYFKIQLSLSHVMKYTIY